MYSSRDIAAALSVHPFSENASIHFQGASIDTRTLTPGNLFIAFKGAQTDGHDYLETAFSKGAAGALISEEYFNQHQQIFSSKPGLYFNLFPVADAEKSLIDLACWYRSKMQTYAVGITGSVGKTSTKEFLTYLLHLKHPVHSNKGNFNNQLGLPLTLLHLESAHRYLAAELGASKKGDIAQLASILSPNAGVLTQISPAHLKSFGSIKDIYDAKTELFKVLPRKAPIVLPEHDELLIGRAEKAELDIRSVGFTSHAQYQISDVIVKDQCVHFTLNKKRRFSFPGLGDFLAYNAALAIAAAEAAGVTLDMIPDQWQGIQLPKGRFQSLLYTNGIRVIDDSYNANPVSFKKAIETFSALKSQGKKIVVISDMLELGEEESKYHAELGQDLAKFQFDYVLAYGKLSRYSIEALQEVSGPTEAIHFASSEEAAEFLKRNVGTGDQILLKASRGMKMEKVLKSIEAKLGSPLTTP